MANQIQFKFVVAGEVQLDAIYDVLEHSLDDLSYAFGLIADNFFRIEKKMFAAEGGHGGNPPWSELRPATVRWREARGYVPIKILHMTGALEDSLSKKGARGNVLRISPKSMEIGSSLKTFDGKYNLGLLHQIGTSKMAARPPIKLTENQKKRWRQIIREAVFNETMVKEIQVHQKAMIGGMK